MRRGLIGSHVASRRQLIVFGMAHFTNLDLRADAALYDRIGSGRNLTDRLKAPLAGGILRVDALVSEQVNPAEHGTDGGKDEEPYDDLAKRLKVDVADFIAHLD